MDPSTQQHSFFAPPEWPRSRPLRKRRRSHAEPPEPPAPGWTPINPPAGEPLSSSSPSPSPSPFPHIDPKSRRGGHTKRYHAILTTHNLPPPPSLPHSLRKKHTTVLITLLHRSLLERDYPRAQRAFGLLIRSKNVDLRAIWRIGVEILQHVHLPHALELLERLVLEFPYTTASPSALVFYPALLNLRVKQGEDVSERVRALTMTPPWTNVVGLWLLRGMVCNWMADLGDLGEGGAEELMAEAETCFAKVKEMGGEVPEGMARGDARKEEADEDEDEDEDVDADVDVGVGVDVDVDVDEDEDEDGDGDDEEDGGNDASDEGFI